MTAALVILGVGLLVALSVIGMVFHIWGGLLREAYDRVQAPEIKRAQIMEDAFPPPPPLPDEPMVMIPDDTPPWLRDEE